MNHVDKPVHDEAPIGHETRDVSFRPIAIAAIATIPVLILIFLLVRVTLHSMGVYEAAASPRVNPLTAQYGRQIPPEPRLQIHPVQDLKDLRARDEAILHNYAWLDETNGRVRLPIERAMELTLQRGLPARAERTAKDGQP